MMKIYRKISIFIILVLFSCFVTNAKVWVTVGKEISDNGGVYLACGEDSFPWLGAYNTNISGLSIACYEVLNDARMKPDPEFTAYEISLRLLDMAHNCREAILYLSDILADSPVGSSYSTFVITDKDEVWTVEYAGKNTGGAVWAALKMPDNCISVFYGKAVIHKLPKLDLRNCLYSPDITDYARKIGKYSDVDFDFAKSFAPADYAEVIDLSNEYASLRAEINSDYHAWGKAYQPISLYDLRKWIRDYSAGNEYYSYVTETNGSRLYYLQSVTYFALGNANVSTFVPIFRYTKYIPEELNPFSEKYIAELMNNTSRLISENPNLKKEIRGCQIALEDSISVDVKVAIEQLPEFEDDDIAIELLQDLADIWAGKVKENYDLFCKKYAIKNKE